MIYFVQRANRQGPVKIGTSRKLSVRLKGLEREAGSPLVVLGVHKGSRPAEKAIHKRFKRSRVEGEWFTLSVAIRKYIATNCVLWDGTDEVSVFNIAIQCNEDWREWFHAYCSFMRIDPIHLVDMALFEHAKKAGFREAPYRY